MKIAVIGTAGRKEDALKITNPAGLYWTMVEQTHQAIKTLAGDEAVHLVSGGAAWADHCAVTLFKEGKFKDLTLHLPAEFDHHFSQYTDDGSKDFRANPGGTTNYYHRIFSKRVGFSSLAELAHVITHGAQHTVSHTHGQTSALHMRNSLIAQADAVIAMTFGYQSQLKPGGTSDTMAKYLQNIRQYNRPNLSIHIDLHTGKAYQPATLTPHSLAIANPPPHRAALRSTMYFQYGPSARPDITSLTTFEAILAGERTATTRFPQDPNYQRWATLKPGDQVEVFEDREMQGRSAILTVTRAPQPINFKTATPEALEEWSKKEGWSADYARAQSTRFCGVQIEYHLTQIIDRTPKTNAGIVR